MTIIVASYFGGHIDHARSFIRITKLIPTMLDKCRFNRRLDAIRENITGLFLQIGEYI